jgi:hypothetical protein
VPGAFAGGAQAYSQDQDVVTGAATGGVLSGILGKLMSGRGASRADDALPTVTGKKLDSTPFFSANRAKNAQLAGEIGITDRLSSTQKVDLIDATFDTYQTQIGKIIEKSDPIPETTILQNYQKNFNDSVIDTASSANKRQLEVAVKKLRGAIGDNTKLNALKTEARKEMGNAFRKGGSNNSQRQEIWGVIYDTVKDSLDSVSPAIRTLNEKQRGLFDLAEEFVPAAQKASAKVGIKVPFTEGATIPTPITQEGFQRFAGNVGRIAASPVTAPLRLLRSGVDRLPSADSAAGSALLNTAARAPQFLQGESPMGGAEMIAPEDNVSSLVGTQDTGSTEQDDLLNTMLQMGVLSGEISPTAAKFILEQQGSGDSQLSPEARNAKNVLGQLQQIYGSVQQQGLTAGQAGIPGRISGFVKGTGAAISQSSPEAATYNDSKKAFLSTLSRGLGEKGVLTDSDISRIEGAIPGFGDTPETAAQKWQTILNILNAAEQKEAQTSSNSSGDLTSLQDLLLQ